MNNRATTAVLLLAASWQSCAAYLLPSPSAAGAQREALTRREAIAAVVAAGGAIAGPLPAVASGGATAGKTTSIPRAKVRYYGRMTEVIIAYDALGAAIKSGEGIKGAGATFFSDKDDAPSAEVRHKWSRSPDQL